VELVEAYTLVSVDVRAESASWVRALIVDAFARRAVMPFYGAKGTVYNAWLMGVYSIHYGSFPCKVHKLLAL
jgi:hypothetical protein